MGKLLEVKRRRIDEYIGRANRTVSGICVRARLERDGDLAGHLGFGRLVVVVWAGERLLRSVDVGVKASDGQVGPLPC